MIALNVYKNLCRARPRCFTGSLAHLSNSVFNGSSSACAELTDSRILEKPVFRQYRRYSSDRQTKPNVRLPALCDFPTVVFPSFFRTIRNCFFINIVVRPQFDNEFDITEFITASKQAVHVVSNALAREDYVQIEGLVTDDVIQSLRHKISTLNDQQKELIAVNPMDIFGVFPYEVGIMQYDDKGRERRFVEIMVVYHIMRGSAQMMKQAETGSFDIKIVAEYPDRFIVCNYRFFREYTKGVDSPWIINIVNHFMPFEL